MLFSLLMVTPAALADQSDLETVLDWMTGSFSSAAQAAEDPEYYHITLEVAPMWQDHEGEHWLYVEQAVAATKDQPYRQRVYRVLENPEGIIESAAYATSEVIVTPNGIENWDRGFDAGAWGRIQNKLCIRPRIIPCDLSVMRTVLKTVMLSPNPAQGGCSREAYRHIEP